MPDPSRQRILIHDLAGSYTHLAEALVGQFAAVDYFSLYQTAFKSAPATMPGVGIEGVTRVEDFFDALDRADLVMFPDVGMIGLQKWLRAWDSRSSAAATARVLRTTAGSAPCSRN